MKCKKCEAIKNIIHHGCECGYSIKDHGFSEEDIKFHLEMLHEYVK